MTRRCPDCKIELTKDDILESTYIDPKGDGVGYEVPVFNCPKCEVDWDEEQLERSEA